MAHHSAAATSTEIQDSLAAGRQLASEATAKLAGLPPRLALLFTTSRHDPALLLQGVRKVVGSECVITGGHAVGIITHQTLGYDGWQAGLALIGSDAPLPARLFTEENLPNREHEVGSALGAQLNSSGSADSDSLLLFYDTVKQVDGKPALNMASPLLAGMAATCSIPQNLAGMGTLGDMQLHPTTLFATDRLLPHGAAALLLKTPLQVDTVVMHGCKPAGRYYEITRTDNQVVLEIDHKPALEVIGEMLGSESELSWDDYAFFVTLGVNKGDLYGPFKEENYANRMCIGVDKARKGLVMFENDLKPGMKVQLMRRAIDSSYMPERVRQLLAKAEGRKPLLAFYIDCAGRAGAYCGSDEEEAVQVQQTLPADVPLLGVYSGVEVARIAGHPQALDWTGVLCLISVPA